MAMGGRRSDVSDVATPSVSSHADRRIPTVFLLMAAVVLLLRVWESRGLVGGYDSRVYWAGARAFLHGRDPYALPTFVVPPSGLLLLAALGWLPFGAAYAVLQLAAAAAMTLAITLLLRSFGMTDRSALLTGLLTVTWCSGTFQTFGFGNVNGIILLCWVLCLLASRRSDERAVGIWFGLGLALKPVLGPIGIVLLLQRRWTAVAWSALVPVALSLAALPFGGGLGFIRDSLPAISGGFDQRFNRADLSLRAVGYRHHLPLSVTSGLRVVAIVVTVAVAVMVWRAAEATAFGEIRTVRLLEVGSVLMLGTLLAAPFGWRYYSVFLLPWLAHLIWTRRFSLPALHVVGWSLLLLPDSLGLRFDAAGAPAVNRDRPTLAVVVILTAAAFDARSALVTQAARQ
ncbi:MAG: rane protein [Frankiales bacterium]|nr:rane protein [Frankiales bacterium]